MSNLSSRRCEVFSSCDDEIQDRIKTDASGSRKELQQSQKRPELQASSPKFRRHTHRRNKIQRAGWTALSGLPALRASSNLIQAAQNAGSAYGKRRRGQPYVVAFAKVQNQITSFTDLSHPCIQGAQPEICTKTSCAHPSGGGDCCGSESRSTLFVVSDSMNCNPSPTAGTTDLDVKYRSHLK